MFCEHCGRKLNDDERFCTACGAPLNYNTQPAVAEPVAQEVPQTVAQTP
ncbi:MAG: zinc ribbon domain-containing protein, partial [Ruminococcus sp.]|nr:zinc ribbon domain-containing protein [Ruminococcus sp.]